MTFDIELFKVFKEVFQAVHLMIGLILAIPFVRKVSDWLYGKITFKELKTLRLVELLKGLMGLILLVIFVYMNFPKSMFGL